MRLKMQAHSLITRVFGSRPQRPQQNDTITLADRGREFTVVLLADLPDHAYQQLFHLDLSLASAGVLVWDNQSNGWRFG
jgi:hypothetical protein